MQMNISIGMIGLWLINVQRQIVKDKDERPEGKYRSSEREQV
jgi:hypothetical protein